MEFLNKDNDYEIQAIGLTGVMLFPEPEQQRNREAWYGYTLLARAGIRYHLAQRDEFEAAQGDQRVCCEDIGMIMGGRVAALGGWERIAHAMIFQKKSPQRFWSYAQNRMLRGLLVGADLDRVIKDKKGVASTAPETMARYKQLTGRGGKENGAENLRKWWGRIRSVAHLWSAALEFRTGLDLRSFGDYFQPAVFGPNGPPGAFPVILPSMGPGPSSGLQAFLKMSEIRLEAGSKCFPAASTRKGILRPEEAWRPPKNMVLADPNTPVTRLSDALRQVHFEVEA